jgi:probable rRNA maturation factor
MRARRRLRRLVTRRRARQDPALLPPPPPLVETANRQRLVRVPRKTIEQAVAAALKLGRKRRGAVSVALVDDRAIRRLHLDHSGLDSATDVLSFPLADAPGGLLGEVVASAETARREARARGHRAQEELLLYVVHGVLHLAGFDDHAPAARKKMRAAERAALRAIGVRRHLFPFRE